MMKGRKKSGIRGVRKGKRHSNRPQGVTKRDLAKARKGMVAWEKLLKRKDEKQNLRALIYLADFRDKGVPRRIEIEFRGEAQKAPLKKLIRTLYRKALRGDAATMREILNGLFGEPPQAHHLEL